MALTCFAPSASAADKNTAERFAIPNRTLICAAVQSSGIPLAQMDRQLSAPVFTFHRSQVLPSVTRMIRDFLRAWHRFGPPSLIHRKIDRDSDAIAEVAVGLAARRISCHCA